MKHLLAVAAFALSMAAVTGHTQEIAPNTDQYSPIYDSTMAAVARQYIGDATTTQALQQAPDIAMSTEGDLRVAITKALANLKDPQLRLLTPAEVDQQKALKKAGKISIGADLQPVNIISDAGVRVQYPHNGSYAAAAGIQGWDQIIMINHKPVSGMRVSEFDAILNTANTGPVNLVVVQHNSNGILNVDVMRDDKGSVGIDYDLRDAIIIPKLANVDATGAAAEAGLKDGDIIIAIDGFPTRSIPLDTVKNYFATGPLGSTVTVDAMRAGRAFEVNVKRHVAEGSVDVFTFDKQTDVQHAGDPVYNTGLLKITNLDWDSSQVLNRLDRVIDQMDGVPGLIVDLRNVGGVSAEAAARVAFRFIKTGTLLVIAEGPTTHRTITTYAAVDGKLVRQRTGAVEDSTVIESNVKTYDGPMLVAVNSYTSNVAAALAATLQVDQRAKLIGDNSSGDTSITTMIANDGITQPLWIQVPTARVLRLDRGEFAGVTPDIATSLYSKPFDSFELLLPPQPGWRWWQWLLTILATIVVACGAGTALVATKQKGMW